MNLYIVRHGETQWNRMKKFQGKLDSPLTELGMEQAVALGEYFKKEKVCFDAIFSSPQGRAYNTAELIEGDIDIIKDERLAEMGFGLWEGKDVSYIEGIDGENYYNFFHKAPLYNHESHKAESFQELEERVKDFLDDLIKNYKDKNVLIVSHGITLKVLFKYIKGDTLEKFWSSEVLQNTSLSLINWDDKWNIKFFSSVAHLSNDLITSWVPR